MDPNLLSGIISYIAYLAALWFGAGLIIRCVEKIAHRLHLSPFIVSFTLLGLLTSIPETAVGLTAVIEHKPEIFVGNLIGGVAIIFLLLIPLLAITAGRITISHQLSRFDLLAALFVTALPSLFTVDGRITRSEGLIMVVLYGFLMYGLNRRSGMLKAKPKKALNYHAYSLMDLLKIALGVGVVIIASHGVVQQTIYFANIFHISSFYISLFALSLGTNLPELSLAVGAITMGKKDIAFGDYLGSAAANTLLFGLCTLFSGGVVLTTNHFLLTFGFIAGGLGLFYYFISSRSDIMRREGLVLLTLYILFMIAEFI